MRYLTLLLTLLVSCSVPLEAPVEIENEGELPNMAQPRNPPIAPVPGQGVPQVAPLIPRQGIWSGYNQLGYQAKYGPDQRARQTILKLDEWGPPEVWTISLWAKQKFAEFNGYQIVAEIDFGAGGSTQVIEVDWINGTQISLPMNAVNVVARFVDVDVVSEGAGLDVGVQISRGARASGSPPVRTIVASGSLPTFQSSENFDIPPFAKNIVVVPAGDGGGNASEYAAFFTAAFILEVNSGVGGLAVTSMVRGSTPQGASLRAPVFAGARRCRILNSTPETVPFSIYAELDG